MWRSVLWWSLCWDSPRLISFTRMSWLLETRCMKFFWTQCRSWFISWNALVTSPCTTGARRVLQTTKYSISWPRLVILVSFELEWNCKANSGEVLPHIDHVGWGSLQQQMVETSWFRGLRLANRDRGNLTSNLCLHSSSLIRIYGPNRMGPNNWDICGEPDVKETFWATASTYPSLHPIPHIQKLIQQCAPL